MMYIAKSDQLFDFRKEFFGNICILLKDTHPHWKQVIFLTPFMLGQLA